MACTDSNRANQWDHRRVYLQFAPPHRPPSCTLYGSDPPACDMEYSTQIHCCLHSAGFSPVFSPVELLDPLSFLPAPNAG
jgi:hypothetical protein